MPDCVHEHSPSLIPFSEIKLVPRPGKSKSRHVPAEEWEQWIEVIHRKYLDEGMTLEALMKDMNEFPYELPIK